MVLGLGVGSGYFLSLECVLFIYFTSAKKQKIKQVVLAEIPQFFFSFEVFN